MKDNFKLDEFKEWRENFLLNPILPSITHTVIIGRQDLEDLLADMERLGPECDCVKIYFLRFKMDGGKPQKVEKKVDGKVPIGCAYLPAGNGMSQICIAITPAKDFKVDKTTYVVSATAFKDPLVPTNEISLVIPGGREDGPGGMNPPPSEARPSPNP